MIKKYSSTAAASKRDTRTGELHRLYTEFTARADLAHGPYPIFEELRLAALSLLTESNSSIVLDSARFEQHIIPIVEELRKTNRQTLVDLVHAQYVKIGQSAAVPTDELLYRAATLFENPQYSAELAPVTFSELMQYFHKRYIVNGYPPVRDRPTCSPTYKLFDPKFGVGVLKMLGLPSDTPYADVTKKVVCTCERPEFEQPVSFAELVSLTIIAFLRPCRVTMA